MGKKRGDIELLLIILGLILLGISLIFTSYSLSKKISSDYNLFRFTDFLVYSFYSAYTLKNITLNIGTINYLEISNTSIQFENICLIKEKKPLFLGIIEEDLFFILPNKKEVKTIEHLLKSKKYKQIENIKNLDIKTLASSLKRNLFIYFGIETGVYFYNVYSKISFKCLHKGDKFPLTGNSFLYAQNKRGTTILLQPKYKDKKIEVSVSLKELFE